MKLSLRTFTLSISATVVAASIGIFYVQTQKILGRAFADIERSHLDNIAQTVQSLLKTRQFALTSYQRHLEQDNSFTSDLIIARNLRRPHAKAARLRPLIADIPVDVADFIPLGAVSPVAHWEISQLGQELTLLSYSPLSHYGERIGTLLLGVHLNRAFTDLIFSTTQARVRFSRDPADRTARPITVDGYRGSDPRLFMTIDSAFIQKLNHETRTEILWLGFASLVLVLLLTGALLEFGFVRNFKRMLRSINTAANNLETGVVKKIAYRHYPLREIDYLSDSFSKFSTSLVSFKAAIADASRRTAFAEMAEQVAHDLKSPISALDLMLAASARDLPTGKQHRIQACLQRIKDTLRALSEKNPDSASHLPVPENPPHGGNCHPVRFLISAIDNLIQEKRVQYEACAGVKFAYVVDRQNEAAIVEIGMNDFMRALSNVIDNSVEAVLSKPEANGTVKVTIGTTTAHVALKISDSGCGIGSQWMPQLGGRGLTFRKIGGHGLGLFFARQVAAEAGGTLTIQSIEGQGTDCLIELPLYQSGERVAQPSMLRNALNEVM